MIMAFVMKIAVSFEQKRKVKEGFFLSPLLSEFREYEKPLVAIIFTHVDELGRLFLPINHALSFLPRNHISLSRSHVRSIWKRLVEPTLTETGVSSPVVDVGEFDMFEDGMFSGTVPLIDDFTVLNKG